MSDEEKMTIDERYKYLSKMQRYYQQAKAKERSQLLAEMERATEMHRKSLIRLMKNRPTRRGRSQQRERSYKADVDDALRVISESVDYVCAERLQPNLVWLAQHLAEHNELETTPQLLKQLAEISISTVRRILSRLGQDRPRLPQKGPEQANRVARDIPMKRLAWDESEPGHFETDLVHHCGVSASGQYVHTLQLVDVSTGWSERVALLGRSFLVTQDGFERILARVPLTIKEIHPDNGSEFLNHHLIRFFKKKIKGVSLSRSRPYHKNDNRFVEQKNSTLVRAYFGYDRLDTVAHTNLLNQLYDKMWLYYNFFQPVMRLEEKIFVAKDQPIKRRFDQAQTPFDRLCQTGAICDRLQRQLETLRDQTNPRQLRQEIYATIDRLFDLPLTDPSQAEDVFLTLLAQQPIADFIPVPVRDDTSHNSIQNVDPLLQSLPISLKGVDPLVTLSFE
jgi:transposase InsO family protein